MHTSAQRLYRIATESPEQLEPCLRRAAFRMLRRRVTAWLKTTLSAAMCDVRQFALKQRRI
jgi:hypothetical protein